MLRDSYHPRALSFLWTETQPCIPEALEFVVSKKRQSLVIHVAQQTHRCLFFQAIIGPPMSLLRKGCQPLVHVVLEGTITIHWQNRGALLLFSYELSFGIIVQIIPKSGSFPMGDTF